MKKRIAALVLMGVLAVSTMSYASDGTTSCSFQINDNNTGVGYLSVNPSNISGYTTIPSGLGTAEIEVQYEYKTAAGKYVEDCMQGKKIQSITVRQTLPSSTSQRKAHSTHYSQTSKEKGYCSKW